MTHTFTPHPKYPWFCKDCGYPPHETLQHSVSDGSPQGQDAKQPDPKDDSAVPNGQTPFPTSPLNEGAWTGEIGLTWPEINARDRTIAAAAFESGKREAESQITTLLTNLAEAQRERDRLKSLCTEGSWETVESEQAWKRRAEAAESRLSHLQTRLEEVEGATIERCAKIAERFAAANRDISTAYQEGRADAGDAIAAHIRAALQPKGESRE